MSFRPKTQPSTKRVSHNQNYATKTPPGTLRLAWCDLCKGHYYGTESAHRARFHGAPDIQEASK